MGWKDRIQKDSGSTWRDRIQKESDENLPSSLTSGVRGFVNAASANFLDELSGAGEAAGRVLGVKGIGGEFSDVGLSEEGPTLDPEILSKYYDEARNRKRAALNQDSEVNPVASTVGMVGGMVASPLNKILPGSMVKQGAALGGINALGASEADNLKDMAIDTGVGAGAGALLGYGVQKATPYIEKGTKFVGKKLGDVAENLSARAQGAERGTIKKLGADKVKEIGRYGLDNNIVTPLASTDDMISRNKALMNKGGAMMDDVYRSVDDAGASTFNPKEIAEQVDDQLGGFYRSPINRGEANQLDNTLDSIMMRVSSDADAIPLREAQILKKELGKVANWKNNVNVTDKERMAREAYGIVSSKIDDAAEKGAQEIGKDGLLETLQQGKKLYGNAKGAETLLENKYAREQGNKMFGLTDTITGAGSLGYGATTGDWETSAAIFAGKKGLEKYGSQVGARGADAVSKYLLKSPQMLQVYQKNPALFQSMVHRLEQGAGMFEQQLPKVANDNNQAMVDKDSIMQKVGGSKYAQVLQKAADKGDQSFAAANFVLSSRDPEYRKLFESEN